MQTAPEYWEKQAYYRNKVKYFSNLTRVLNGPYKGLKYPLSESHGSAFYPKIFGTYEQELTPFFSDGIKRSYSTVVDIGCAEGYHSIGLGRLYSADVFAFDTSRSAQESCSNMAALNDVNLTIGGLCTTETLLQLPLGKRAIILIDCEGYELELLSQKVAEDLKYHDFVIECHDFKNITTSAQILSCFIETHDLSEVLSTDDIQKAYSYEVSELEGFSLDDKYFYLSESRPTIMKWVIAKSRN